MRPAWADTRPPGAVRAATDICHRLGARARTGTFHGAETFCAESGQGRTLLAVHGLHSCFYTWRHLLARPPEGWQVLAPDMPGFGASEPSAASGPGLAGMAEFLADLLHSHGGGPAVLCGHSYGALACLELAASRPDLAAGLALIGSPLPGAPLPDDNILNNLMLYAYHDHSILDSDIVTVYRAIGIRTPGEFRFLTAFPGISGPIPGTMPCLDVRGEQDRIIPPETDARMRDMIPGVTSRRVNDAGHCPHEERPEAFGPLLHAFLSGLS